MKAAQHLKQKLRRRASLAKIAEDENTLRKLTHRLVMWCFHFISEERTTPRKVK